MKVEIVSVNDENFNIKVPQMGDVFVACNAHCSCIGKCEKDAVEGLTNMLDSNTKEEVLAEEPLAPQEKPAVPLENHKQTNSFDWFSGTSFGGNKQSF